VTVVDEIRAGVRLREAGKVAEANDLFLSLCPAVEEGDDAFARCFLAHSLADVQDDPREELRWDLLALAAAADVTEERAAEQEVPGGRLGLYPSLHLNLAEDYVRLGDDEAARRHYLAGREHLHLLDEHEYGQSIRAAFEEYEALHPEQLAEPR
jgi:hypothetical protein